MTTEITNNNNNTISLEKVKEEKVTELKEATTDLIGKVLIATDEILEEDKNSKGIFTIIFDSNSDPKMLWGGDVDYIKMLGSFDLAKLEVSTKLMADRIVEES